MQELPFNKMLVSSIKLTSTCFIIFSMGLAIAKVVFLTMGRSLSQPWMILFWLGILALGAHGVEGIVAGVVAHRRGDSAIRAWIRTFFTGTVGLMETIKPASKQ